MSFNGLDEILSWNIFFDYLMIKLHPNEIESEYLRVIRLKNNMEILKIKDTGDATCKFQLKFIFSHS